MTDARDATPDDILAFWREAGRERWYTKDATFDADIRDRFFSLWQKAAAGELSSWEASDDGALALVIILDQFPRNMFRDDAETYSTDPQALEAASRAIVRGADQRIDAACWNFSTCRSCIRSIWPTSSVASNCFVKRAIPTTSAMRRIMPTS